MTPTDADKARWYDEIAPRLTSFGPDLPHDIVVKGVNVLHQLRAFKAERFREHEAELFLNVNDLSCFLMCVEQFWERNRNADVLGRLAHNTREDHGV